MAEYTTWWVNGVAMPSPMTMDWSIMDISGPDDGRTLDGKMHKTIVSRKRKLNFKFPSGLITTYSTILKAVGASATFSIKYWDREDDDWRTSDMYVGDRQTISHIISSALKRDKELSFNLIEV